MVIFEKAVRLVNITSFRNVSSRLPDPDVSDSSCLRLITCIFKSAHLMRSMAQIRDRIRGECPGGVRSSGKAAGQVPGPPRAKTRSSGARSRQLLFVYRLPPLPAAIYHSFTSVRLPRLLFPPDVSTCSLALTCLPLRPDRSGRWRL